MQDQAFEPTMRRELRSAQTHLHRSGLWSLGPGNLRVRARQRGLATIEYVIVLLTVTLLGALVAKAVGPYLVRMMLDTAVWLSLPVP